MPALQKFDEGQSKVFPLKNGTTTIGRGAGCQVVVSSLLVSKTHAKVTCRESVCSVVDLSSNGTRLNGRKLPHQQNQRLKHGDQIEVGPTILIFLEGDSPEDWSGTKASPHNLTVLPATVDDPDESMRRQLVKTGESVVLSDAGSSEILSLRKILFSIGLHGLPLATLTANDSVRMTASFPDTPFDQSDLERLAILAQILAIVMPGMTGSASGFPDGHSDFDRSEALL